MVPHDRERRLVGGITVALPIVEPSPNRPPLPRWTAAVFVLLGWTAVGLASAGTSWANWQMEHFQITLGQSVLVSLPYWVFWAFATPGIVWLARRWPLTGRNTGRTVTVHLLAAALCALLHGLVYAAIYKTWFPWPPSEHGGPPWPQFLTSLLYNRSLFDFIIYAAILGGALALTFYREAEQRALSAAQLQAQLAQAQLAALRMQLNPHFLFNTLQAISTLTLTQPRAAQRMLTRLGDLLRSVLDGRERQEITLAEELGFLRDYLEIEQTRFPDRLAVAFDVPPEASGALVPSFILQPLVENAIRHGIAPRAEPGRIDISVQVMDGRLALRVTNDGPSALRLAGAPEGVGLSTTRARLFKLYGDSQELRLDVVGGRAQATILMPHRVQANGG
jgi:hypothetical protein